MAKRRSRRPSWVGRVVVDAIHDEQWREHGGLPGIRDENAVESALARPEQKWRHGARVDLSTLAAAYAFGLARNHPYRDGNKRIAFLAMVTFLGLNGYDMTATNAEVLAEMLALAEGALPEDALADWIREHSVKRK